MVESHNRFTFPGSVSRETLERLEHLRSAVSYWNSAINLVSSRTVDEMWFRHVVDSAQLWPLRPARFSTWTDLGSGGGFPGLVVSILAAELHHQPRVYLIEADCRKAAFLSAVVRELRLPSRVVAKRAEIAQVRKADVLTARAFAPLDRLIPYISSLRAPGGVALLHKGRSFNKELDAALRLWDFDYRLHPSVTDPDAAIIEIGALHGKR